MLAHEERAPTYVGGLHGRPQRSPVKACVYDLHFFVEAVVLDATNTDASASAYASASASAGTNIDTSRMIQVNINNDTNTNTSTGTASALPSLLRGNHDAIRDQRSHVINDRREELLCQIVVNGHHAEPQVLHEDADALRAPAAPAEMLEEHQHHDLVVPMVPLGQVLQQPRRLVPVVVVDWHMTEHLLNPTVLEELGELDVVHQELATVVFAEASDIPGSVVVVVNVQHGAAAASTVRRSTPELALLRQLNNTNT